MPTHQLSADDFSAIKQKAIEDARRTQASIAQECADAGTESPIYALLELIGKGSFGRVYKATSTATGQLVAVKIISIEEGDSLRPGAADTFSDILKEVNTLKLLRSSGARNINHVIDTLLVGQSVWMVTEYCAGGSVASLMRPTGGLPEKWVIPILREVAEALNWVHRQGIIHRDIKCANVLVTEPGNVQICDFGVAGIIESKFDKRKTVTGTLQWMAPELFDSTVSYGIEVDIWAFGSMAYEVASGLPPNAIPAVDISQFGPYLKQHLPRLEGEEYSTELKDLVSFCMIEDPLQRPPIDHVQKHPYLFNTDEDYPTASLSKLVKAYKLWETQGGSRRSLFSVGGAQGPTNHPSSVLDDGWEFGTTYDSEQLAVENPADTQVVYDVYGPTVGFPPPPPRSQPRRRRQPPNMKEFKIPLQKVFDPNTISKYDDNTHTFYGRPAPPLTSDLPLRDESELPTVRESLIDLDISQNGGELDQFADLETIKPVLVPSNAARFNYRRTQDWTFPAWTPASGSLPPEPSTAGDASVNPNRASAASLIDLDASLDMSQPEPLNVRHALVNSNRASAVSLIDLDASLPSVARPYTAMSDGASTDSEFENTPFGLGSYAVSHRSYGSKNTNPREPSLYAPDGLGVYPAQELEQTSPYATPVLSSDESAGESRTTSEPRASRYKDIWSLPSAPSAPSTNTMQGTASRDEVKAELQLMISSLGEHLQACNTFLRDLPVRHTEFSAAKGTF